MKSSTSTGATYTVTCSIGQPDAGKMNGGGSTIDGGFWGIIAAVQTPGVPLLTITLNSQPSTFPGPRHPPASRYNKTPTASPP